MRPSLVLLSIDSLRHDSVSYQANRPHLDALGITSLPATPNFDRLTEGSFAFTQAVATAPYTTSSHASLLTGRVPPDHGVRGFQVTELAHDVRTLPEILGTFGYASMLMTDTPWLFKMVRLDAGFDATAESLADARAWWQEHEDQSKLLLIHLMDVHVPYGMRIRQRRERRPERIAADLAWIDEVESLLGVTKRHRPARPKEFTTWQQVNGYVRALHQQVVSGPTGLADGMKWYLAGLQRTDGASIKAIVDWFDEDRVFDNAYIVLFGDHGEGSDRYSNLHLKHACLMFDDVVRVPLSIRPPGPSHRAGGPARIIGAQVSLVDLAPTLLEMLDVPEPDDAPRFEPGPMGWMNGRSLVPLCNGGSLVDRPVYGEYWGQLKTKVEGKYWETLRHRILRWPDRKYSLIGRDVRFDRELARMRTSDFLRVLRNEVAGRPGLPTGSRVESILAGLGPWARRGLVRLYERLAGGGKVPKAARYDLVRDPLETDPIKLNLARCTTDVHEALETFTYLDRHARRAPPTRFSSRRDIDSVEERLRALGYVD